mmetsp:Transcript_22441/g.50230  ORF Transcript_22441/g.50230 Transcript_22441/m.50230 type:complete len:202 (+) Transcript_22441:1869-2474(+)
MAGVLRISLASVTRFSAPAYAHCMEATMGGTLTCSSWKSCCLSERRRLFFCGASLSPPQSAPSSLKELAMLLLSSPAPWPLLNLWKYFCACVRVCTTVRVFTILATFFHSLPYFFSACRKSSCSWRVHRPVDSLPWGITSSPSSSSPSSPSPPSSSSSNSSSKSSPCLLSRSARARSWIWSAIWPRVGCEAEEVVVPGVAM